MTHASSHPGAGARQARSRSLPGSLPRLTIEPVMVFGLAVITLAVVCAAVPSWFAPYGPNALNAGPLLAPPSWTHPLGTDEFGRDILSRVAYATRLELLMSAAGVLVAVAIGLPLGLVAGHRGGVVDAITMRLQDALLAFPAILFAILVVAAFGASALSIILTIGVIYIPRFARLVRGSVLFLKEEDFVTASRSAGAADTHLVLRHILPNCFAPLLVQITLALAVAILIEAGLSYLGLGVQPPTPTWGNMLNQAQAYPAQAPWYVLAPGICIFLLVLAINLVGDSLRDSLDPKLRRL